MAVLHLKFYRIGEFSYTIKISRNNDVFYSSFEGYSGSPKKKAQGAE